jgi:UDP-glucose 4-epimerase
VVVAVVGSSGFIGCHVVRRLRDGGFTLLRVDRRPPAEAESGERVVRVDLGGDGEPERAAAECGAVDAVVWLAASIRHRYSVDQTAAEEMAVMVEAPLRFLAALRPAPSTVVYTSSIQVYGRPQRLPVDEDHPTNPFTAYGVAKLTAEHYVRIWCRERGIPLSTLRVAFVYGPGQHSHNVIPRFIEAVRRGEPPVIHGGGGDIRDDVYAGDVAEAVHLAISRRADGTFNVATGRPHTLLEVAEAVCRLGGAGIRPRHLSEPGGWVDRWFAVERARRHLGFEAATSFEEGLFAMWRAAGAP